MGEADKLRDRAARLFALSLKAREGGTASSAELEQLAYETLVQAEDMEHKQRSAAEPAQHVAQQQPQPDPDKGKE